MLVTVETFLVYMCSFFTAIKIIKNDEICVRVAFLPHKHLTMTDQTASWLTNQSRNVLNPITIYQCGQ